MSVESRIAALATAIGVDVKALQRKEGLSTFVYTSGLLTSIAGPGSDLQNFYYTDGLLTSVVCVRDGVTTTTALTYVGNQLTAFTRARS